MSFLSSFVRVVSPAFVSRVLEQRENIRKYLLTRPSNGRAPRAEDPEPVAHFDAKSLAIFFFESTPFPNRMNA